MLVDHVRYLVDSQNLTGYSQVLAEIGVDPGTGVETMRTLNTVFEEIKGQTHFVQASGQGGTASETRYLHTDGLGSIRSLTSTSSSGQSLDEQYNYTAFGSPFAADDGDRSLTPYAFTGQRRDATTEMQYHRARWLVPGIGKWLSCDTGFDFPASFGSPYQYVGGNPATATDPSGCSLLDVSVTAAVVATLAAGGLGVGIV